MVKHTDKSDSKSGKQGGGNVLAWVLITLQFLLAAGSLYADWSAQRSPFEFLGTNLAKVCGMLSRLEPKGIVQFTMVVALVNLPGIGALILIWYRYHGAVGKKIAVVAVLAAVVLETILTLGGGCL